MATEPKKGDPAEARPAAARPAAARPAGRHLNRNRAIAAAAVLTAIFLAILFVPTTNVPEEDTTYQLPKQPQTTAPRDLLNRLTPPPLPPDSRQRRAFEDLDALLAQAPEPAAEDESETLADKLERLREQLYISGLNGALLVHNSRSEASEAPSSKEPIRSQLSQLRSDLAQAQAGLPHLLSAAGSAPAQRAPQPPAAPQSQAAGSNPRVYLTRSPAETRGAVLHRGTVIPAILITGIHSDLPGQIRAQVRRDVFDTVRFDQVTIPRGSALLGTYDQDLAIGQNRLFVRWSQLRFPDGSTVDLPESPGVDLAGASGIRDRVNHHTWPVFRDAALLGLVSATFQLAQPADDRGDGSLSNREIAAGAVAQEFEHAAGQLLQRQTQRRPTIRIRPGLNFNVLVTRDLVFPIH